MKNRNGNCANLNCLDVWTLCMCVVSSCLLPTEMEKMNDHYIKIEREMCQLARQNIVDVLKALNINKDIKEREKAYEKALAKAQALEANRAAVRTAIADLQEKLSKDLKLVDEEKVSLANQKRKTEESKLRLKEAEQGDLPTTHMFNIAELKLTSFLADAKKADKESSGKHEKLALLKQPFKDIMGISFEKRLKEGVRITFTLPNEKKRYINITWATQGVYKGN